MPTTLIEHRTRERDRRAAEALAWSTAFAAVKDELIEREGPDSLATAARKADEALEKLDREIEALRGALEASTAPVEMAALAAQIATKSRARRVLAFESLEAHASLDNAKVEAASFESLVRRAASLRKTAEETLDDARRARDEELAARAKLAVAPLSSAPATAVALLSSAVFTAARAKLQPPFLPVSLFELVERRFVRIEAAARLADVAFASVVDHGRDRRRVSSGLEAAALAERVAHERARRSLVDFVNNALNRLAYAETTLVALGGADPWSVDVADALATDAAARDAAQVVALAFEDALMDRDAARAARNAAAANVRADDPLAADAAVDADPAVQPFAATLAATEAALAAAAAAYTPADRERILVWQSLVPEEGWSKVLGFLRARRALQTIAGIEVAAANPASLQAKLDASEGVYGDALEAAALHARALAHLDERGALANARREHRIAEKDARLRSAMRGTGA